MESSSSTTSSSSFQLSTTLPRQPIPIPIPNAVPEEVSRDLRDTPDDAEPSYAEEDNAYKGGLEDDVEDEFHRRLASTSKQQQQRDRGSGASGSGGGGGGGSGTTYNYNNNSDSSLNGGGQGGSGSSFWRTDSLVTALPTQPVTLKARKSSGGLLGAALQLHSQSSNVSDGSAGGGGVGFGLGLGTAVSNTEGTGKKGKASSAKKIADKKGDSSTMRISVPGGRKSNSGGTSTSSTTTSAAAATPEYRKSGSNISQQQGSIGSGGSGININNSNSNNSSSAVIPNTTREGKKNISKQRAEARRLKLDSQLHQVDIGHVVVEVEVELQNANANASGSILHMQAENGNGASNNTKDGTESLASNDSSDAGGTSNNAGGGLFHGNNGKSPASRSAGAAGALFGKSSSLIFPTGVEPPAASDSAAGSISVKRTKINVLLDQCETVRFPFKKKLLLSSLGLNASDIPVKDLYGTNLGNTLHKLCLDGNRLSTIPPKLVTCLPALKTLDLSQCELHQLPERWNLPQLKRLNLSHNRLTDFPEESMLEGLLELSDLNMYGNKVSVIVVPHNPKLLAKLEILNLGYNDLAYIPDDLDRLKSLRTLKVMNNFLEKIPMRVCDMELKTIDVSSNPVIQPPIETCERGICSMKRYYHCLRMEEQSKQKALEALQSKATRQTRKASKGKKMFNLAKPNRIMQISLGRKSSDDTSSVASVSLPQEISVSAELTETSSAGVSEIMAPRTTPRSVSLDVPTVFPSNYRSAAFSLHSHDEMRRSKSLDVKPQSRLMDPTPSRMPSTPEWEAVTPSSEDLKSLSNNVDDVTVNDTLKVIFVGMAMAGKTSMIKRLIEGETAVVPKRDERTVGVDIYEWDPKDDRRFEHIDSRIELGDKDLVELCGDVNVKFSVWDFAGQHVYHATHELFFSPRALYVLVWDMGATNPATKARKSDMERGPFSLNYDSDADSDDEDDFTMEEEIIRADRALKRDIDDKIQFWVDCIQSSAPGAAILPVASFDDVFASNPQEAKRRCNILKQRLLEHEAHRIDGIKERLKVYEDNNRANHEGALRLRKLLGSYTRPKLIFGNTEDDAVVRVSGTKYTGFADLTERIINIATGREKAHMQYPIFRGHVGARIPRMRLEVREAVRQMRDRFKVVEWGYFIRQLEVNGLTNVEDIGDALHFLTNIGELSYFGGLLPGREAMIEDPHEAWAKNSRRASMSLMGVGDDVSALSEDEELEDEMADDTSAYLSIDNTGLTLPTTEASSLSTLGDSLSSGLSQFVFLNPRWLVAAVACILRHDLDREIQETRRALAHGPKYIKRGDSFYEANLNCPVITADDACMLWQAKKFTKKAAERVEEYSNNMPVKPFEFLQLLLIRFGVFVPIDLGIEKAILGGKEYARRLSNEDDKPEQITIGQSNSVLQATFFFLPSLLGPGEPAEAWTYKSTDSWKATLCHSVLFPDGVPPGLMERITASVLSNIYAIAHRQGQQTYRGIDGTNLAAYEGQLTVKEVLCWRTAFLVKVGMRVGVENKESITEVFCGLVDKESHLCVGSNSMLSGMRRLVTSGKGQEGDGGRKIWKGGYLIVLKAVQKVMDEYGGLEYEKQGFCPDCLAKKAVAEASFWDFTVIRGAIKNGESIMHCSYGHRIDTRLVAGPLDNLHKPDKGIGPGSQEPVVPIHDLLRGVVVVGLWDGHSKSRKVIRVGSGFIADKKRGLIVTAAHTLMNIWGEKSTPFGENYYGLRNGKIVIGIIPKKKGDDTGTEAVFRYFAKIVSKDPFIEQGVCHLDACVLKITTRMENDVSGNGEGCGDEPERLLLNNPIALKQEKLHQLKITDKCELDEQVRIVGYNQGGEGLLGPGSSLNRYVDFARGYVCKKFAAGEGASDDQVRHRFKPREEIVIICPTIGGHSGGPCVNQQGEVIGILSRADPAESQRCYLVPTYEWRALLKEAKNAF